MNIYVYLDYTLRDLGMIVCVTNCEGLVFEREIREDLFRKHQIYCRPVGVSRRSRGEVEFQEGPYLCDRYAMGYLHKNKIHQIKNLNLKEIEEVLE